jgi:transcriptional regulator with XRE-family HTH domain
LNEVSEGRHPNPVDLHVGGRVRMRRKLLGMSQEHLADALGLTFQQVQKYERGANRVSASKLYDMAKTLQVPVAFFFDGLATRLKGWDPTSGH